MGFFRERKRRRGEEGRGRCACAVGKEHIGCFKVFPPSLLLIVSPIKNGLLLLLLHIFFLLPSLPPLPPSIRAVPAAAVGVGIPLPLTFSFGVSRGSGAAPDLRAMEGEFQDWELLHSSSASSSDDTDSVVHEDNPRSLDDIEAESGGMIRPDYFSIDGSGPYPGSAAAAAAAAAASEEGDSVHSDNPSWIDPAGPEARYTRKDAGEFWSDSGSDLSDERKLVDLDPKVGELVAAAALAGGAKVAAEAAGGLVGKSEKSGFGLGEFDLGDLGVEGEYGFSGSGKKEVDVGEIQGLGEDSPKFWSASGGERLGAMKLGEDMSGEEVLGVRNDQAAEAEGGDGAVEDESLAIKAAKPEGDEEKRGTVWWKVPFELLRYCVFRVSPFWSLSVAAAFLGFVVLGRRLYKTKQKTRTLQLKITVDDKVNLLFFSLSRLNSARAFSLFCFLILHTMCFELVKLVGLFGCFP